MAETKKVTLTVVRDDEGEWKVDGKSPIDVKVAKDGTVTINPTYTVSGTIAVSVANSESKISNEAESSVTVTPKPRVSLDKKTAELIAGTINERDWVSEFGNTPRPPVPPGPASDDDKPIVIQKPDGSTIVLPPRNPKIKSFVIRYIHWDGTAREYVVSKTDKGWKSVSRDDCKPITDENGTIVTINAACSKTKPKVKEHDPELGKRKPGAVACLLNPKTGQYEYYDSTGEFGAGVLRDGTIADGEDPPAGLNKEQLKKWFDDRIGFTGVPCKVERERKYTPREDTRVTDGDGVEVRTNYQVRDYSRTVEVREDDNLVIRIPNDPNRPVIDASLAFEAINVTRSQLGDNGEIETVPDNGPKLIQVRRENNRFVVIGEKPAFVQFNETSGVFTIPAASISENSEIRLTYRTLQRIGVGGGVIGAYTDDKGTWVPIEETSVTKMDKEALSFIDERFNLLPPDIAAYKQHFLILVPQDTGTSSMEVSLYNDKEELLLTGNSALAPNGFGWITSSDAQGYVTGNTNDGSIIIQRTVFNGNKGKIVATTWDKTKTMSKSTIFEFDYTNPAKVPELDMPIRSEWQPERPFVDQDSGTGYVKVMDKKRTYSGVISFMNPTTNSLLNYRFTKVGEWGGIRFEYVPNGEKDINKGIGESIKQFIKVIRTPEPTFIIPHWCITDYSELKCTVDGDPGHTDQWLSMASTVVVASYSEAEVLPKKPLISYLRQSDTVVVSPDGKEANVIRVVSNEGKEGAFEVKIMDMTFGIEGAGERDWQIVNSTYVPLGYSINDGSITVAKDSGTLTIQKAKSVMDKYAPIIAYARGKNPQGDWVKTELAISLVPKPIDGPEGLGEIVREGPLLEFIQLGKHGIHVNVLKEGYSRPTDEDGSELNFNSQRVQVILNKSETRNQEDSYEDTGENPGGTMGDGSKSPVLMMLVDVAIKTNDRGKWEIDTETSYSDSPFPMQELVKVNPEDGTAIISQAAIEIAHLQYIKDNEEKTAPFKLEDLPVTIIYAATTGQKGVFMKGKYDAKEGGLAKDLFVNLNANVFTKGMFNNSYYKEEVSKPYQQGYDLEKKGVGYDTLMLPITRIERGVVSNSSYNIARWIKEHEVSTGLMVEKDDHPSLHVDTGNEYGRLGGTVAGSNSSVFNTGGTYVNKLPSVGRIVPLANIWVRDTDQYGPYTLSVWNDLVTDPRDERYSLGWTLNRYSTTAPYNPYPSSFSSGNAWKKIPKDLQGLDQIIYGVHGTEKKLRLLSLRKVKERIKLKDAPFLFYVWTDDGKIPDGLEKWNKVTFPGVMFPVLINKQLSRWDGSTEYEYWRQGVVHNPPAVRIGLAEKVDEGLRNVNASWEPRRLIAKLLETYGERYVDEVIPNLTDLHYRTKWTVDLVSDEKIDEYMRYYSIRGFSSLRSTYLNTTSHDMIHPAWLDENNQNVNLQRSIPKWLEHTVDSNGKPVEVQLGNGSGNNYGMQFLKYYGNGGTVYRLLPPVNIEDIKTYPSMMNYNSYVSKNGNEFKYATPVEYTPGMYNGAPATNSPYNKNDRLVDLGSVQVNGQTIHVRLGILEDTSDDLAVKLIKHPDAGSKEVYVADPTQPYFISRVNLNYNVSQYPWHEWITEIDLNLMKLDDVKKENRDISVFCWYHLHGGWYHGRIVYNPNEENEEQSNTNKETARLNQNSAISTSFQVNEITSLF